MQAVFVTLTVFFIAMTVSFGVFDVDFDVYDFTDKMVETLYSFKWPGYKCFASYEYFL